MNQKGFSLVEVKVCCAIITVLACTSYPVFSNMQQSRALHKEIRTLYSNLQHAKIAAIKHNSYVVFKTTDSGYHIFVDDGNGGGSLGDWVRQPQEKQLAWHTYQEGISLERNSFTGNRTRFNGRVCMKAGRVILKNKDGAKTEIVVSTLGRIRVEKI